MTHDADDRIERLIDRAASSLTEVPDSPAFTARVMARIDTAASRARAPGGECPASCPISIAAALLVTLARVVAPGQRRRAGGRGGGDARARVARGAHGRHRDARRAHRAVAAFRRSRAAVARRPRPSARPPRSPRRHPAAWLRADCPRTGRPHAGRRRRRRRHRRLAARTPADCRRATGHRSHRLSQPHLVPNPHRSQEDADDRLADLCPARRRGDMARVRPRLPGGRSHGACGPSRRGDRGACTGSSVECRHPGPGGVVARPATACGATRAPGTASRARPG